MPGKNRKKKGNDRDPFFTDDSRKRRKIEDDAEIDSDFEEDGFFAGGGGKGDKDQPEEVEEEETGAEARKRIAQDYLRRVREITQKEKEQQSDEDDDDDEDEDEGARDSLVAQRLLQDQQEESGRVRRAISSRFGLIFIHSSPFF